MPPLAMPPRPQRPAAMPAPAAKPAGQPATPALVPPAAPISHAATPAPTIAPDRITRQYKWHPSRPDHRDLLYAAAPAQIQALPAMADLRPHMPPVYDQGQLGSCTANAIGAAMEFERMRQGLPAVTPSRLFIYFNERLMEGTVKSDSGAQIRDGIKSVASKGVCPESEWPYTEDYRVQPVPKCYADALKEMATQYSAVRQDLTQLRTVLAGGSPVVLGITVYASFESDAVAATGAVPMPTAEEQCLGGHAVLLVGYSDASRRFTVRNSWGAGWGQAGYFTIPYDYVTSPQLASDMWVIKLVTK